MVGRGCCRVALPPLWMTLLPSSPVHMVESVMESQQIETGAPVKGPFQTGCGSDRSGSMSGRVFFRPFCPRVVTGKNLRRELAVGIVVVVVGWVGVGATCAHSHIRPNSPRAGVDDWEVPKGEQSMTVYGLTSRVEWIWRTGPVVCVIELSLQTIGVRLRVGPVGDSCA